MDKETALDEIKRIILKLELEDKRASEDFDVLTKKIREASLYEDEDVFELITEINLYLRASDIATTVEDIKIMFNRIVNK